jgi:hypothetical protein
VKVFWSTASCCKYSTYRCASLCCVGWWCTKSVVTTGSRLTAGVQTAAASMTVLFCCCIVVMNQIWSTLYMQLQFAAMWLLVAVSSCAFCYFASHSIRTIIMTKCVMCYKCHKCLCHSAFCAWVLLTCLGLLSVPWMMKDGSCLHALFAVSWMMKDSDSVWLQRTTRQKGPCLFLCFMHVIGTVAATMSAAFLQLDYCHF